MPFCVYHKGQNLLEKSASFQGFGHSNKINRQSRHITETEMQDTNFNCLWEVIITIVVFMCQFGWLTACLDIWLNILSEYLQRCLYKENWAWIVRLREADIHLIEGLYRKKHWVDWIFLMSDWRHRDAHFLSPLCSWFSYFYLECLWITYSLTNSYLYKMYLDQIYHKLRPLSPTGTSTFPPPHHLHNFFQMIIPAVVLNDLIGLSHVSISIATMAAGSSLLQWPCQDYSVSQHSYPFSSSSMFLDTFRSW